MKLAEEKIFKINKAKEGKHVSPAAAFPQCASHFSRIRITFFISRPFHSTRRKFWSFSLSVLPQHEPHLWVEIANIVCTTANFESVTNKYSSGKVCCLFWSDFWRYRSICGLQNGILRLCFSKIWLCSKREYIAYAIEMVPGVLWPVPK